MDKAHGWLPALTEGMNIYQTDEKLGNKPLFEQIEEILVKHHDFPSGRKISLRWMQNLPDLLSPHLKENIFIAAEEYEMIHRFLQLHHLSNHLSGTFRGWGISRLKTPKKNCYTVTGTFEKLTAKRITLCDLEWRINWSRLWSSHIFDARKEEDIAKRKLKIEREPLQKM